LPFSNATTLIINFLMLTVGDEDSGVGNASHPLFDLVKQKEKNKLLNSLRKTKVNEKIPKS